MNYTTAVFLINKNCRAILARIEQLAAASDADWCLYSDADEWRRSPRLTETLAEGIARVDAQGYNAIDFRVFAFFCTDDAWSGDPEKYFRFYNYRSCFNDKSYGYSHINRSS